MDIRKVGNLIAEQRRKLGYTQDDLGQRLGVSGKAVSKWERGLSCPDIFLVNRLAVELKLSIAQLLSGDMPEAVQGSNSIRNNDVGSKLVSECLEVVSFEDSDEGVVSPYLFGNNLEHTRSSIFGGLSAQMIKNRKFVGKPSAMEGVAQGWYIIGKRTYCSFGRAYTHHYSGHYHMHRRMECQAQGICNMYGDEVCGIGQHELNIVRGEVYEFAVVIKSATDMPITIRLCDRFGHKTYAQATLDVLKNEKWVRYTAELTPNDSDEDTDLTITFEARGHLYLGSVSMMNKNNFRGMRPDVIKVMKEMGIKLLRWPGGNFAGEYNWFDGLLPVDERAPYESYLRLETQPHTLGYDFHEINTDDFIALCREIGAEPFITINPAWCTPEENAAWVEYCNGDVTTEYGKLRAERGFPEPYHVMLWSLGNEFGYGHMEGDNSANGYSHLARANGEKMLTVSPNLTLCSSGPYPSKEWIEYSAKPLADISKFVSLHYYAFGNNKYGPRYEDLENTQAVYENSLSLVAQARDCVRQMRELLGENDVRISFDEWNMWFGWFRPSCVTDGLFTAMMMHMIIGAAQQYGIGISCQFEAVNESAIKVTPTSATLTATGQAIALMAPHANGILRYAVDCVVVSDKEGVVTLTAVNPSYDKVKTVSFPCDKQSITAELYEGKIILPHSQFEVSELAVRRVGDRCEFDIPPHSMARVQYS